MSLVDFIQHQLQSQLVGGGLLLMFTGSLIALARSFPGRILGWCKRLVTRAVSIESTDPLFDYVTYWLNSQERFTRSRLLRATTAMRLKQALSAVDDDDDMPSISSSRSLKSRRKPRLRVFYSAAAGRHFFRYRSMLVSISQGDGGVSSQKPGVQQYQGQVQQTVRTYYLESYGKDDGLVLKALIEEIIEFGTEETEGIRLYYSVWGHWTSNGYTRMRPIDTVVLPEGTVERVLTDMREFRSQQQWYRDLGIPWHKGYLFYGLPGTGKTSLAAAMAGELDMDIYLMSLSGTGMNDERLQQLMSDVRPGCMVILEDIDCTIPERGTVVENRVTLSGLLNCLDGIMSREGCAIVMTTNRRESLDPALIRPGRVDFEMSFTHADDYQIERLAAKIGVSPEGLYGCRLTMAEVQKALLDRYRLGPKAADELHLLS